MYIYIYTGRPNPLIPIFFYHNTKRIIITIIVVKWYLFGQGKIGKLPEPYYVYSIIFNIPGKLLKFFAGL